MTRLKNSNKIKVPKNNYNYASMSMTFDWKSLTSHYDKYAKLLSRLMGIKDPKPIKIIMDRIYLYNVFYQNMLKSGSLYGVRQEYIDRDMWKTYITRCGNPSLYSLPTNMYDKELLMLILKKQKKYNNNRDKYPNRNVNGLDNLLKVRDKRELWDEDVVQAGKEALTSAQFIAYCHPDYITYDIVKEHVEKAKPNMMNFNAIPDRFKTEELCDIAVTKYPSAFQYVPIQLRTKDLCLKGMKLIQEEKRRVKNMGGIYYPSSLVYNLPDNVKNNIDNIMEFASIDPSFIKQLPDTVLTKPNVIKMVSQNWEVIKHLPGKKKLKKPCEIAVQASGSALKYIPKRYKTKAVCESCFDRDPKVFHAIPDEYKTEEMCLHAVRNGSSLSLVPLRCRTEFIMLESMKNDSGNIRYIDQESMNRMSDEFFEECAKLGSLCEAWYRLPKRIQDIYNLMDLLRDSKSITLWLFSNEFRTREVCELAVSNDLKNFSHVPDAIRYDYDFLDTMCQAHGYSDEVMSLIPRGYDWEIKTRALKRRKIELQ